MGNTTNRPARPAPRPNRAPTTATPDAPPVAPDAPTDANMAVMSARAAIRPDATADDIASVVATYVAASEPIRRVIRTMVGTMTDDMVRAADPRVFPWMIAARDHMVPPPPVSSARTDRAADRDRVIASVRARVATMLRTADAIANGTVRPVGTPDDITWTRADVWPGAYDVMGADADTVRSMAARPVTRVDIADVFARAFAAAPAGCAMTAGDIARAAGHPYVGPINAAMDRVPWLAAHGYTVVPPAADSTARRVIRTPRG